MMANRTGLEFVDTSFRQPDRAIDHCDYHVVATAFEARRALFALVSVGVYDILIVEALMTSSRVVGVIHCLVARWAAYQMIHLI